MLRAMTEESGYRAPAPRPVCTRCGVGVDATHAALSSDGGLLCARCEAETAIAARVARAPRPLPWNDAKIAFGVGAALLVGAPVSIVGLWQGWLDFGLVVFAYSIGMPLVAVTATRAIAARPTATSQTSPSAMASAPAAASPAATASPAAASPARSASTGLAIAGAGMATAGCGVATLVIGAVLLAGLALVVVVALYVLKYFLGFSSIPWP